MTTDNKLAHALKIKFGLDPAEPTAPQLAEIKRALLTITIAGHQPTDVDWRRIVSQYCPSAGQWKYAGIDNSDLNALLALAIQSAKGN